MTIQQAVDWCNSQVGKSLDYDGAFGAQCTDFFNFYYKFITGRDPYADGYGVPGAKDLWSVNTSLFTKVANNPSDPSQLPPRGSILIYNGNLPGAGGFGHVAIVDSADSRQVTVWDQNWGGMSVHHQSHTWTGYETGWLIFNGFTNLQNFQREVGANGVNYRDAPNTSANIIKDFQPGEILDFKGFVRGGTFNGNNVWFVGKYTNGYAWSGAFKDTSAHDLPDLTQPVAPAPTPVPTPTPTPQPTPSYTFSKDFDIVTEVIPAAIGNFETGNFPDKPQKVVIHEFGTKGVDTIGSTINHFTQAGVEVSAHFVVSGKRIVQMVSLKDRAYHAGPNGNDFVGIESDPYQDPDTIASVVSLLKALKAKYGYTLAPIKHSSIMATLCGQDINLDNYQIDTPTPSPSLTGFTQADRDILNKISTDIGRIFK